MQTVVARAEGLTEARGRWLLSYAWLGGLVAYLVAIVLTKDRAAIWINDVAWTLSSACAAWACLSTSRRVERPRRRAWLLFGLGCVSWLIGQLDWDYSQLTQPSPNSSQARRRGRSTRRDVLRQAHAAQADVSVQATSLIQIAALSLVSTIATRYATRPPSHAYAGNQRPRASVMPAACVATVCMFRSILH